MRSFADPAFFRVLDMLVASSGGAPGSFKTHWKEEEVTFDRAKHSSAAGGSGFIIEICSLTHPGPRAWRLIAVKEYWHLENSTKLLRQVRWAKLLSGTRTDALTWFKQRESEFERRWEASDRLHRVRSSDAAS
jgi:hypothetical protein